MHYFIPSTFEFNPRTAPLSSLLQSKNILFAGFCHLAPDLPCTSVWAQYAFITMNLECDDETNR